MNTRYTWNMTGRYVSFVLVLLFGAFAAGCGIQSLAQAPDPKQGEAAPEKPKAKMEMMCPMMSSLKGVELYADSPVLLAAQAEELGLNEEQKKQLEEIAKSAREQARKIMTPEQRKTLEELPEGPLSMMQIAKMRMKGKKGGGDEKMMCPMCMKMMKKMQEAEEPKKK